MPANSIHANQENLCRETTQTVYFNGKIYSLTHPQESPEEAMLIEKNRILALGSSAEIFSLAKKEAKKIDLMGGCVLPGFQDSHCHLLHTAIFETELDVHSASSPEEIIHMGREYIQEKKIPAGQWIHIIGYDQNQFPISVLPDGSLVNAISDQHPILLERICGHVGAANPLALSLSGITPETHIPGGCADVGADGKLTGVLRENALGAVSACIPKPTPDEIRRLLEAISEKAASMGITTVHSDDLSFSSLETLFSVCETMEKRGTLAVRIWEEAQAPHEQELQDLLSLGYRTGSGSLFKLGNIKLYTDGSLGARTAFMRKPYEGTKEQGIAVYEQEELDRLVFIAHSSGMQIAFHAIGDGALEQCVSAVEKAQSESRKDLRHRIVHCQIAGDDLLLRMKKAHLCADIQPPFVPSDAPLVEPLLGTERAKYSYRWKTMLQMGIPLGGGSDSPVESMAPLWGIRCAVTRKTAESFPQEGWHAEENLSVYEAVSLYTKGGAYLSFEEKEKGTLEPGKLADFVVLGQDIFHTPPEQIHKIPVWMTVMDGNIRYTANPI